METETNKKIREAISKAVNGGVELGMKKQILDDLEWIEDNFTDVRVFVTTRDAIIERKAKLNGILEGLKQREV